MRALVVALLVLLYAIFCWWCWWRYQRQQQNRFALLNQALNGRGDNVWLVAYASQTGTAEKLAQQTAQQLEQANIALQSDIAVRVVPLNKVTTAQLRTCSRALFIVSTYGEGEAPDNGNRFLHRLDKSALDHLHYAVLALGDKTYSRFCAFGQQLHHRLQAQGAHLLFDLIEVDRGDDSALRHWQYFLGQLTGHSYFADWNKPSYEQWRLLERSHINSGSQGAPVYVLRLQPAAESTSAAWEAGDIAEIGPHNDPALPHREYSIASIPATGTLDLLVRQVRDESGKPGLGSGWLTQDAQVGSNILLRVRSNSRFHAPAAEVPMILIGNGTGIAGLRAHLFAREKIGAGPNWLFFGERNAACDLFFKADIRRWQASGVITHLDLAFSRDPTLTSARYVQDLLPPVADKLRQWVAQGAAIFVCGSLQGMAEGVDHELASILGREQLEALADARRYCRDVY